MQYICINKNASTFLGLKNLLSNLYIHIPSPNNEKLQLRMPMERNRMIGKSEYFIHIILNRETNRTVLCKLTHIIIHGNRIYFHISLPLPLIFFRSGKIVIYLGNKVY